MLINGLYFHREQYLFIWKIAFLSLFSSTYAIYNSHYDLALVPGGVFLTSINYWRKPVPTSWRRYIDITYIALGVSYQSIRAFNAEYSFEHYITLVIAMSFYPIGIYFYNKKQYWYSTYSHSMIHIIANLSNVILYSGNI